MNKLGIANLLILAALVADLGNVGDEIGHTSGLAKWGHLTDLLPDALKLSQLDFSAVKAEIKDLDAAERAQLEQVFKDKFSIQDKSLESVIEDGISLLEDAASLFAHSAKFVASVKALKA